MNLNKPREFIAVLLITVVISPSQTFAHSTIRRQVSPPQKEPRCPPVNKLDHGSVMCVYTNTNVSCASAMRPGTIAVPTCNPQYKPDNFANSIITCLSDGTWDFPLPTCNAVCGEPKRVWDQLTNSDDMDMAQVLFPWHVYIYRGQDKNWTVVWEHVCYGTLLSDRVVVTDSRCVHNVDWRYIHIKPAYRYTFIHHDYFTVDEIIETRHMSHLSEIALIILEKPPVMDSIMPICIGLVGGTSNVQNNKLNVFVREVTLNFFGRSLKKFQYKDVSPVDRQECNEKLGLDYSGNSFCFIDEETDLNVSLNDTKLRIDGGGLTVIHDGLYYIKGVQYDLYVPLYLPKPEKKLGVAVNVTSPVISHWIERQMSLQADLGRASSGGNTINSETRCPPLKKIYNGHVVCVYSNTVVSCDSPMRPNTTAVLTCNPEHKPRVAALSTLTCLYSGTWDRKLHDCQKACGVSKETIRIQPQIAYGQEAHIGLFPWHAGVYHRNHDSETKTWTQKCGGSLITASFVLTAAHCLQNVTEADVAVALGKYYRSWDHYEPTEQKRGVSKILYPDEYRGHTYQFDFGLLLVKESIRLGDHVMPVCHGFEAKPSTIRDKPLYVVGWGKNENEARSDKLMYNEVSMMPPEVCYEKFPPSYSEFEKFCIGKESSAKSVSQAGDSGGGVTVKHEGLHYITGIISVKFDNISAVTNITWHYDLDWIENQINKYDAHFKLI